MSTSITASIITFITPTTSTLDVIRAVDLCAAPGSWSQLLAHRLRQNEAVLQLPANSSLVVSIDLQEMAPIDNCRILQGDITLPQTADRIVAQFDGKLAQLVVCDGAPDVTGFHDIDEHLQSQLLFAAISISARVLEIDGSFVAKFFKSEAEDVLVSQMKLLFHVVDVIKPSSSRHRSAEHFIIGKHFRWPRELMSLLMIIGEFTNNFEGLVDEVENLSKNEYLYDFFKSGMTKMKSDDGQQTTTIESAITEKTTIPRETCQTIAQGLVELWSVMSLGKL